jgi:hypothetical protein
MFRDESTKVIQKAHAQWGVQESEASGSGSVVAIGDPGSSSGSSDGSAVRSASSSPTSTASASSSSPSPWSENPIPIVVKRRNSPPNPDSTRALARVPKEISPTEIDKGIHFYIQHYLIGHPDEARSLQDLREIKWLNKPNVTDMMAAVGLASLSNLTGQKELETIARQKYGSALQHTSKAIQTLVEEDKESLMRAVVMLAMFEVRSPSPTPSSTFLFFLLFFSLDFSFVARRATFFSSRTGCCPLLSFSFSSFFFLFLLFRFFSLP